MSVYELLWRLILGVLGGRGRHECLLYLNGDHAQDVVDSREYRLAYLSWAPGDTVDPPFLLVVGNERDWPDDKNRPHSPPKRRARAVPCLRSRP